MQTQSHSTRVLRSGTDAEPLVLRLTDLDGGMLALVGGKAANLGELNRAGLPVPAGFCVTTRAYALVATSAGLEPVLAELAEIPTGDVGALEGCAARAREALLAAPVPEQVSATVLQTYGQLGGDEQIAVAVRSSATAEDLPFASFAGQQDTYLNILGHDALMQAVRRCWASLWTDRAVAYRTGNGIDHRAVRLAVVVQQMVDAHVAGVMFTANPLTGRRRQIVVDASPGLGEAVVSGAVTPDHFVVDASTGEIVERRIGDRRMRIEPLPGGGTRRVEVQEPATQPCLSGAQVRELARLGTAVEAHYGAPQDVEWALNAAGRFWLLQARPITTLFPLPDGVPQKVDGLRVYFSFNVAQGVYRPLTPMGIQAFRLLASGFSSAFGRPPPDPTAGPPFLAETAGRLFLDLTPVLRSRLGRRLALFALRHAEARSAAIVSELVTDPRLGPRSTTVLGEAWSAVRVLAPFLLRHRLPARVLGAWRHPDRARQRMARAGAAMLALDVRPGFGAEERIAVVERVLLGAPPRMVSQGLPVFAAGLLALAAAARLLDDLALPAEVDAVRRGLPHNPTTEMDLELWAVAERVRQDDAAAEALRAGTPDELARRYRTGALPPMLQQGLAAFLSKYGHRGVAEIDLGLPRWSDDPAHLLGALANYLQVEDAAQAPAAAFAEAARRAEAMAGELARRAARRGRLRGLAVRFLLSRARALLGLREAPKFHMAAVLAKARALLAAVGAEFVAGERLDTTDDVFFVTLPELRAGLAGADLRPVARQRRATYERELRRRHVPRILLSDGTEPEVAVTTSGRDRTLRGTPASAGVITGKARVVLEPEGARLEPGEILVAPSTDPGWTPLFLTAGGLVMEMGGPMSHGAVVAREYGIPAVVGVADATERIETDQLITVDGSAGTVAVDSQEPLPPV